jgi:hypothetical protein
LFFFKPGVMVGGGARSEGTAAKIFEQGEMILPGWISDVQPSLYDLLECFP